MILLFTTLLILFIVGRVRQKEKQKAISTVTSLTKGEPSERNLVYRLIKGGIPPHTIFHDLYVPTTNGHSQIDLVVPTNVGIFVIEVKDYSGWIFGNGLHDKWTKVLAYGQEKHQFYNPIKQNERHIEALRNALPQLNNIPFFSIVVFDGSSEIREISNVPYNCRVVYPRQVVDLIKNAMSELAPAPYTDKWEVMNLLKQSAYNGYNDDIVSAHLRKAQMASRGKYQSTYSYEPRFVRKWRRFTR
jgi:hypothetical protein